MFLAQTTGAQVADAAPHLLGKLIEKLACDHPSLAIRG